MRDGNYRAPMSLTAKLTIVMVVLFALQSINQVYFKQPRLLEGPDSWLALTRHGLTHGWVWQLITYQFLHGGFMHLLFNALTFWWVGHFCEQVLGRSRMLIALLGAGVVGGLLQGALMLLFREPFAGSVVGASAGVSGLFAIFCLLNRHQEIRFNFILPVPAMVLLYAYVGISLFFTLVPTKGEAGVAHAAHLGGLLAGIAWVKLGWHQDYIRLPWESWMEAWRERRSRRAVRLPRPTPAMASAISRSAAAAKEARTTGPTEFISKEVDPILDKIAAHGIHSLTDDEKRTLERARTRIEKR
jgi:membrane associated rhomboid family serine protease